MSLGIFLHNQINYRYQWIKKGKATPITGLWGPEGSGRLRLQITRLSTHEGGKVVTGRLYPQEYPGTHF